MKKLLYGVFCVAIVASLGCAITDYPQITDDRGDFSGVIRTGHKAYILPTSQVGTIWDDGSDELFSMVYQNNYGDQKIYTFNNFDPSAAVVFLDQTYCDWRYEGCEITRSWNPHQDNVDNVFDYEFFPDCSGARSLSLLVSNSSRVGECGDAMFSANMQNLAEVFSQMDQIQFRGERAYLSAINADNTTISFWAAGNGVTAQMPILGSTPVVVTSKLQTMIPVLPQMRYSLTWLKDFSAQNGSRVTATINHSSMSASVSAAIVSAGLAHNIGRF
jgi:hypothetical protein